MSHANRRTHELVAKDIREHPERHLHTFDELQNCCFVEGAVDLLLLQMHSDLNQLGSNGGTPCDVTEGPCACGAWH